MISLAVLTAYILVVVLGLIVIPGPAADDDCRHGPEGPGRDARTKFTELIRSINEHHIHHIDTPTHVIGRRHFLGTSSLKTASMWLVARVRIAYIGDHFVSYLPSGYSAGPLISILFPKGSKT